MSSRGFGPGRNSATPAGGGGGGTVTGADNGLSLNATIVELGGTLINSPTQILLDGNQFEFDDTASGMSIAFLPTLPQISLTVGGTSGLSLNGNGSSLFGDTQFLSSGILLDVDDLAQKVTFSSLLRGNIFSLDMASEIYRVGSLNGGSTVFLNTTTRQSTLGTVFGAGNETKIFVDDLNRTVKMYSNSLTDYGFNIDYINNVWEFGDITGVSNGVFLRIDNAAQEFAVKDLALDNYFQLDIAGKNFYLGDIDNGMYLRITGNQNNAGIVTQTGLYFRTDVLNGLYNLGDVSNLANGMQLLINDTAQNLTLGALKGNFTNLVIAENSRFIAMTTGSGSKQMLRMDKGNNLYQIGDIDATLNGGKIELQDASNILVLRNTANNLGISINGTAGFSGTVSPVTSITVKNGIVTAVS